MVNCVTCHKSFRFNFGKSKSTRCESCAKVWRRKQLVEEEATRLKEEKDIELRFREVLLKEKQLEMEKQKITIKETLPGAGNIIELTCYYDQHSRAKVTELLAGARLTLPRPPPARSPETFSSKQHHSIHSRRRTLPKISDEYLRPRKLPSIEGIVQHRSQRRSKLLEDECSTSANTSGLSVD